MFLQFFWETATVSVAASLQENFTRAFNGSLLDERKAPTVGELGTADTIAQLEASAGTCDRGKNPLL